MVATSEQREPLFFFLDLFRFFLPLIWKAYLARLAGSEDFFKANTDLLRLGLTSFWATVPLNHDVSWGSQAEETVQSPWDKKLPPLLEIGRFNWTWLASLTPLSNQLSPTGELPGRFFFEPLRAADTDRMVRLIWLRYTQTTEAIMENKCTKLLTTVIIEISLYRIIIFFANVWPFPPVPKTHHVFTLILLSYKYDGM